MPQKKQSTKGLVMKARQKKISVTQVGRCRMTRSAIKRKQMKDVLFVINDPKRYPTPAVPTADALGELLRKHLVIEAQQKKRSAPRKTTIKQQEQQRREKMKEFVKAKIKELVKNKQFLNLTVEKKELPEPDYSRLREMTTTERERITTRWSRRAMGLMLGT